MNAEASPNADFDGFLSKNGLLAPGETAHYAPLTGGVSSDIWRVDLPGRQICIKRALEKLKVADDWHAPISRNATEVGWLNVANEIVPGSAPEVLAHDADAGMFAMAYIDPVEAPVWKSALSEGKADTEFAAQVGKSLAAIHAASMTRPELAQAFATDQPFHAIRLEPYLETTARRHPDLAASLNALVAITASTKMALVHGDVSPKNILMAPTGPVFLDAECAWWGDPAFDLAFCLNHMLLKCLWVPAATADFLACYQAMGLGYFEGLPAAVAGGIEVRTAHLLPGLFLARIDGKSPVEYVTSEADKERVRRVARQLLTNPVSSLATIGNIWAEEMGATS